MYKLKRSDIEHWCDQNSYIRGQDYLKQGRVYKLRVEEVDRDEVILHSTVQGRPRTPYEQEINIDGLVTGDVEIAGDCSCPVGFSLSLKQKIMKLLPVSPGWRNFLRQAIKGKWTITPAMSLLLTS